ncbi:hypothetical protein P7K49_015490 [Saguinus oedipus]|uniref:Secreted protein n=1 Tax=Saguinus oedipus TaxID=9490 RepID=A0ABQ9V9Q1_SAGOE|nr:hypothetical protein P7K49_015490 [Saguinus oedipus]
MTAYVMAACAMPAYVMPAYAMCAYVMPAYVMHAHVMPAYAIPTYCLYARGGRGVSSKTPSKLEPEVRVLVKAPDRMTALVINHTNSST